MGPSKALIEGRKRGIYFDTGTGGGSFKWSLAVPMVKDGFIPDSISTDLHIGSMNSATKDMLNVASKMMAIGLTLNQAVAQMTSHPAHEVKRDDLGNSLSARLRMLLFCGWSRASSASPTWSIRGLMELRS